MKRSRIKPASDAKLDEIEIRRQMKVRLLARDGGCRGRYFWPEISCGFGYELDEYKPRDLGGDPTNDDHVQVLCGNHHRAKTEQHEEACRRGLAAHSWDSPLVPPLPTGDWPRARDFWNVPDPPAGE